MDIGCFAHDDTIYSVRLDACQRKLGRDVPFAVDSKLPLNPQSELAGVVAEYSLEVVAGVEAGLVVAFIAGVAPVKRCAPGAAGSGVAKVQVEQGDTVARAV